MDNNLISVLTQGTNIGAGAAANSNGTVGASNVDKPTTQSNALLEALTKRLTQQGQGISSSSSTNLQDSINEAIGTTVQANELSRSALESERVRELGFARDRASATYTNAMESRSGYATQVQGLRELTETTEKSVRDLDMRYKELMLKGDSETAKLVSDLQIQKLKFQQEQEQNFFSNLLSAANLQQEAVGQQLQSEQFWTEMQVKQEQFVTELAQSNYQFEKNYGLNLQEMGLKEQQLELDRARYNLSVQEYNDKKKALTDEKNFTNTKAIIANGIKNRITSAGDVKFTKEQLLSPDFMLQMKEQTGFDGSTEELAGLINEAYVDMSSDKKFMASYLGAPQKPSYTTSPNVNSILVDQYNKSKAQYDADTGVTISSPDSYFSGLFR